MPSPLSVYSRTGKPKRARRRKPRFGATETVSGDVAKRSGARMAALGGTVKGVDGTDGYTGREARLIKRARATQKLGRKTVSSTPVGPLNTDRPAPAQNVAALERKSTRAADKARKRRKPRGSYFSNV